MTTKDLQQAVTESGPDISTRLGNSIPRHTGGLTATGAITGPVLALRVAAGASAVAGVLHYAAVPEHRAEWLAAAVFFTALAALQIIWAALVWCDNRRRVLFAGLLINAATVALWAVSRTSGLPFGPEAGDPESIGVLDTACGLAEVVTLAVLLALIPRTSRRPLG